MNVLVTAGNTQAPIDRVRCITNVFSGRTGAGLALEARRRGHAATLLTSRPEAVGELSGTPPAPGDDWDVSVYRTFSDLQNLMERCVKRGGFDAVVHCAAVSDYLAAEVYAPDERTRFDAHTDQWMREGSGAPKLVDRRAAKVKSDEPELWLRLVRAPKLIDCVRQAWHYKGVLVKFKLEVDISQERLLQVAEASRVKSAADLMVANTLEGSASWALMGPLGASYQKVSRGDLATRLLAAVEALHARRGAG